MGQQSTKPTAQRELKSILTDPANLPRIRESWDIVTTQIGIENLGRLFYRNFFEQGGERIRRLFVHTNMEKQQEMLMSIGAWCLSDSFDVDGLERLARIHAYMGIDTSQLKLFCETLLTSMRSLIGKAWKTEYEVAWKEAFQIIENYMAPILDQTKAVVDGMTETGRQENAAQARVEMNRWFFDQATAVIPTPDFSGYLQYARLPPDVNPASVTLKRRYFELNRSLLYVFTRPDTKPEGLLRVQDMGPCEDCKALGQYAFKLNLVGGEVCYFVADGATPMEKWMNILSVAEQRFSTSVPAPSVADMDLVLMYGQKKVGKFTVDDFDFKNIIGKGSFGKVYKVVHNVTKHVYALKVINKEGILSDQQRLSELTRETSILGAIEHPFIVRLHGVFQTRKFLFLVFDFLCGGDVLFHLKKAPNMRFDETRTRFYMAEIALAVSYLHTHSIIHRDLKADNIVLDVDGHAVLTDFGFAKVVDPMKKNTSTCGTLAYLAPEVLKQSPLGYGFEVDWWSLGVVMFTMLTGCYPFLRKTPEETAKAICYSPLRFPPNVELSSNSLHLLSRLLEKRPRERLASINEFMSHPWFAGLDFDALTKRTVQPPFIPDEKGDNTKYFPDTLKMTDVTSITSDPCLTSATDIFKQNQFVHVMEENEFEGSQEEAPVGNLKDQYTKP
eukprot:PhF_6_TR32207/c0_g1_i1/m.47899